MVFDTSVGGATLAEVMEGSVAERAGLQAGDSISAFNGQPVYDHIGLSNLSRTATGKVPLKIVRNGKVMDLTADFGGTVASSPQPSTTPDAPPQTPSAEPASPPSTATTAPAPPQAPPAARSDQQADNDARMAEVFRRMKARKDSGKSPAEQKAELIAAAAPVRFADLVSDLDRFENKVVTFDATWLGDPAAVQHLDELAMGPSTVFDIAGPVSLSPTVLLVVSDEEYKRDIQGWERWKGAQVTITALIVGRPLDREAPANGRVLRVQAR